MLQVSSIRPRNIALQKHSPMRNLQRESLDGRMPSKVQGKAGNCLQMPQLSRCPASLESGESHPRSSRVGSDSLRCPSWNVCLGEPETNSCPRDTLYKRLPGSRPSKQSATPNHATLSPYPDHSQRITSSTNFCPTSGASDFTTSFSPEKPAEQPCNLTSKTTKQGSRTRGNELCGGVSGRRSHQNTSQATPGIGPRPRTTHRQTLRPEAAPCRDRPANSDISNISNSSREN